MFLTSTPTSRPVRVMAAAGLAAWLTTGIMAPVHATPVGTVAARGTTAVSNAGTHGRCVWYVLERFHRATGVYPAIVGNAWRFAAESENNGWTVSDQPRVRSVAVFPRGVNGASHFTGHVAWVERVSGAEILVAEMNVVGVGVESRRWITPAPSVRYVYAP